MCLCLIAAFPIISKEAHKTQSHSAYEALRVSLIIQLDGYYSDNGRYPDSLNELTEIEYSDGASAEMLSDFKYTSNGNSCEISYFSAYFERTLRSYLIEGELKSETDD